MIKATLILNTDYILERQIIDILKFSVEISRKAISFAIYT